MVDKDSKTTTAAAAAESAAIPSSQVKAAEAPAATADVLMVMTAGPRKGQLVSMGSKQAKVVKAHGRAREATPEDIEAAKKAK